MDEPGTVSMDRPQRAVDRPLSVSLLDEDEGVAAERWQWARSEDGTTWTDIEGATSPKRSPAPDDVGMYLRATVAYSDKFGAGKTASAVSATRWRRRPRPTPLPSFAGQDDDESTPTSTSPDRCPRTRPRACPSGEPVSATDADDVVLVYELLDTPDLADDDGHAPVHHRQPHGPDKGRRGAGSGRGEGRRQGLDGPHRGPALPDGEDAGDAGNSEYVLRGEGEATRRPPPRRSMWSSRSQT